jgi:uncharacterized protein YjaG (DUF416 family)
MEQEFNEEKLLQELKLVPFWKQLAFLTSVCKRLIPSFFAFSKETGALGTSELESILQKAVRSILKGEINAGFESDSKLAESFAPETEEHSSIFTSSALDAATAISILANAFDEQHTSMIVEGAALARDSVDMFIQEIEELKPNDPQLELKILQHKLMQKELKRQREDLKFLQTLSNNLEGSERKLQNALFDKSESCLGLQ